MKNHLWKKINKRLIKKNDNVKILIAPHDFFDAVHIYGETLFEDFYEWLNFLGQFSKTNYDWYIKNGQISQVNFNYTNLIPIILSKKSLKNILR